jgi:hypothetical protein
MGFRPAILVFSSSRSNSWPRLVISLGTGGCGVAWVLSLFHARTQLTAGADPFWGTNSFPHLLVLAGQLVLVVGSRRAVLRIGLLSCDRPIILRAPLVSAL